jgi:hypothetical protein
VERFTLERKLFAYALLLVFGIAMIFGIGILIYAFFSENDAYLLIGGIYLAMFGAFFVLACVSSRALLAEFEVDSEKIKVFLPMGKIRCYYFSDIVDAGIYDIHHHDRNASILNVLFVGFETRILCFSKKRLSEKDKMRIGIAATEDMVCIRYREDIMDMISQVYDFDKTLHTIHR